MTATTEVKIDRALAKKVLSIVDKGLVKGLGKPKPGEMCVEAAVNYAMGADHGDDPACVGRAVRAFKIRLNDAAWPSNEARTEGMRKLAIAQLGSDKIDQREFANYVVIETVKRLLPITLRTAASLIPAHKEALEGAAAACEVIVDLTSARAAARAAREKAYAAEQDAAADAYSAYAISATCAAAAAAYADTSAADAYAADAYSAACADAAADAYATAAATAAAYASDAYAKKTFFAKRLEVLKLCAQIGLEALQKLNSPGCEWLDLCE